MTLTHKTSPSDLARRALGPLRALNFFMADMQAGIGPFLGVFLLAHGWESGLIGTVMSVGGIAGMVMTAPAGAVIDATPRKRLYVIIPGVCRSWHQQSFCYRSTFGLLRSPR